MVQILKLAESDHELLGRKIKIERIFRPLGVETRIRLGATYTIEDLVSRMVVFSDSESRAQLQFIFKDNYLWKSVFSDLGYQIKTGASYPNIISAKTYSTLLRVLYNRSYLNGEMSQKALYILSQSAYRSGIVKGVDNDEIIISNKYGLRIQSDDYQLHESAIVYLEDNPYLLTVMTEGKSHEDLKEVIVQISNIVHQKCLSAIDTTEPLRTNRSKTNTNFLINPLLDCSSGTQQLPSFSKKISQQVNSVLKDPEIESVSVYFRHLNGGQWFCINPDSTYIPVSLMKVPSMMSFMKKIESDHSLFEKVVTVDQNFDDLRTKYQHTTLSPGADYSVSELLQEMIINSDNYATHILHKELDNDYQQWDLILEDLGISHWKFKTRPKQGEVSVSQIALFFNVLYNATYLNREFSESALNLLSGTSFPDGMRGNLNSDERAALKYGERYSADQSSANHLHECGIVYQEENPFLLCIMTKGSNMDKLATSIQNISKIIKLEVSKEFPVTYTEQ